MVEITDRWCEMHAGTGVSFFSVHPGWADTETLKTSMPGMVLGCQFQFQIGHGVVV